MTELETIGSVVAGLFATGGAGWAVVAEAMRLRDKINIHESRLDAQDEACRKCRESVEARLASGSHEFSSLKDGLNETKMDLLETVKDVANDNAEYRQKAHEQYISETTFKDRVIATMIQACPSCRKGGTP